MVYVFLGEVFADAGGYECINSRHSTREEAEQAEAAWKAKHAYWQVKTSIVEVPNG